jgi:hypothetical protein
VMSQTGGMVAVRTRMRGFGCKKDVTQVYRSC